MGIGDSKLPQPSEAEPKEALADPSYNLRGIVVHYGSGLNYGHYWSLARSQGSRSKWIEFDDTKIRVVDDREIQTYYGTADGNASWSSAYMLLYESADLA